MIIRGKVREFIHSLISQLSKHRTVTVLLAFFVVLLTTFMLILPGYTLEQDAADAMPGMDVTAASEEVSEETEQNTESSASQETPDSENASETGTAAEAGSDTEPAEDCSAQETTDPSSDTDTAASAEDTSPDTGSEPAAPAETTEETAGSEPETDRESMNETQDAPDQEENPAVDDPSSDADNTEQSTEEDSVPLAYKGEGYTVTIDDPSHVLPADTELRVQEIIRSEDPDAYEGYYKDSLEALQAEQSEQKDTVITDLDFARFYDISLVSGGTELTKLKESVTVRIEYDTAYPGNMSVSDPDSVRIIHFAEDKKSGKTEAEPLDDKIIEVNTDKKDRLTDATFEAEGFSVYAVVSAEGAAAGSLNGKSFGILNNKDTVSGTALMTNATNNNTRLGGKVMTVRTEPVERTGIVFVAKDSDIAMWKFISAGDNKYYITTETGGTVKYLRVADSGVTLTEDRDDNCLITVKEGTGSNAGKIQLSNGSRKLHLNSGTFDSSTANNADTWMNLAELSDLQDDDFVTYTAAKVSISDTAKVPDGAQVIVYTRIWNDDTKRYEYYAVDHDGMLVRAYESGDTISWVGSKINTMLWDFTEHHYEGTDDPNYYYDLQNSYSDKYLAPHLSGGDAFLKDEPVGINLDGRRNGEYYSSILAWDDDLYDYASLCVKDGKLASSVMSEGSDFYFAIMTPQSEESTLSTVATIDHKPFGITVKMQDYEKLVNYSGTGYRSSEQVDVLGNTKFNQWTGSPGLLDKNLTGDYPGVKDSTHSLSELYDETMEVNHQFIRSTYEETGYFEYDSTQNFAHLIKNTSDPWYGKPSKNGGTYDVGDFVIYDQLGTTDEGNKDTLRHGQFLPYNDILDHFDEDGNPVPVNASTKYTNERDIKAESLSSLDPRKGETLYNIPYRAGQTAPNYVDHFFGMELTADFMQSESGLDAWGHDLIFEFSGDDDFWFYIDGKLVLDLGGIHSALSGSINFRTGQVIVNGKKTNLRTLYREAYLEEHPGADNDTVNAYLNEIFADGGSNTGTVFKPYTGHPMKMFYMERGAGASNLHMRFNLAAYTKGEVLLEKEVSGTDSIKYTDTKYPFQIWYKDEELTDGEYRLWTDSNKVVDASRPVNRIPYKASAEIGGKTYEHVYYLRPGQTASVKLPHEGVEYYIKECGIDSDTYDKVSVNRSATPLEPTADTADRQYKDFAVDGARVSERKKVIYDNHVGETALKTLSIVKKVWADEAKSQPWDDDTTPFRFRIYIGKQEGEYSMYSIGAYRVKNTVGEYCFHEAGGFVSSGKTVFEDLSDQKPAGELRSERQKATFYTSPSGIADRIPAGYTIEIPGLVDGTPFLVEERASEIPSGYELIDYDIDGGEYTVDDSLGDTENYGTVSVTEDDPVVTVNNRHGYGLSVKKNWADAAFMKSHDDIYFAVYLKDGDTVRDEPLEGSVRRMAHPDTEYTWFLRKLEEGKTLNDYLVYEVALSPADSIVVDEETGEVSGYDTVTRIEKGGSMEAGGVANDHGYSATYVYTADYDRKMLTEEELTAGGNSRTDEVTNARPGIKLVKTDLEGNPLAGGGFTMQAAEDGTEKNFESGEDGLIAVAYLQPGKDYILAEKSSPEDHQILIDSVTVRAEVDSDGNYHLLVNGSENDHAKGYYTVTQVSKPTLEEMPTVTIRNKPFTFRAVKTDAESGRALEGVEFALYAQRNDQSGNPVPDYRPMAGFESLVTDAEGTIPKIDGASLAAGSYYLREKEAPAGYKKLGSDIHFTITKTGGIVVENDTASGAAAVTSTESDDATEFIMTVRNTPKKSIRILKKSMTDHNVLVTGAKFELYSMGQIEDDEPRAGEKPIVSGETGEDGIIGLGPLDEGMDYYLFETDAPEGYSTIHAPVIIRVTSSKVSASLDGKALESSKKVSQGKETWTITVYDPTAVELPASGGIGTTWFYLFGSILVIVSGVWLTARRRTGVRLHK